MRSYINPWILLTLSLIPCQLFAAKNPVSWTVTPSSGFSNTHVGSQSTIKYTLTNQFPQSILMTASESITGGNFTVRDECKGVTLATNASCNIYVGYNPAGEETSTFQLVYGYHKNRIPTTKFSVTGDEPNATLGGSIIGLPSSFYQSDTPNFIVRYVNKSNATITSCTDGGSPLSLTGTATATATLTSVSDGCNGQSISAGSSCDVTGTISSTTTLGDLTLTGNLTCTASSGTVTVNPSATSTVESGSGCTLHTYPVLPLPQTTYTYADNIVQFEVENECGSTATISNAITTSGPSAIVTTSTSSALTTCGSTLSAHSSCFIAANIRSTEAGTLSVINTLTSGSQVDRASTSATVNTPGYNHNVTFINQCPKHIWIGIVNAGTNKEDPTSPSTPDDYKLSRQRTGSRPLTKTVTFSQEYLGGFWARTNCAVSTTDNSLDCDSGNCTTLSSASGKCTSAGALAPFTGLEMNFFTAAQSDGSYDGVYDVTIIGGMNVPVLMKGFGPTTTVISPPPYNNSAFQCNSAGSTIQNFSSTGLASCPWTFTIPGVSPNKLPAKSFYFVTNDATPSTYDLTTDDNCGCASGKFCGLAMGLGVNNKDNNIYFPACGQFRGYLTVNSLCGAVFDMSGVSGSTSPKSFYNCTNSLNTQLSSSKYLSTNTVSDLYTCNFSSAYAAILNSCFLDASSVGHNNSCCGAQNWSFTAQDKYATVTNPDWLSPTNLTPSPYQSVLWLKNGCPTAYTYPFDDHFGSFYCKKSATGDNVMMDYEVVYCPGGIDGVPSSP